MAPKNLASSKRRPKQDDMPTPAYAKEQSDQGAGSNSASGAAGKAATILVPAKKPKFATPFKQPAPEPVENGSACSSPSASGFIIAPSQKPRREKKTTPVAKVFTDDDVISLLKGLAVFWANGRNNKWAEFHHFVKDDLPNQFTKTQVSEKIRNLKKKFDANVGRARANGGRIFLSDPHESAVFELSKALWGDDSGIAQEKGGLSENGDGEVLENDEGSKSRKKRKQVGEHGEETEKMRKREHGIEEVFKEGGEGEAANAVLEEGDVRDAANTILSIRKLVEKDGESSKKKRKKKKKKRKQGNEIAMEGMQVEGTDEGNKISTKQKQVDGSGERNKKTRKTKLVDECGEVLKGNQADQHEEEELLIEGKQVDEHEKQDKTSKKQKQVDGHDVEKDLAKQGKRADNHREEHDIPLPANQTQKMGISVDDFRSACPLLYASFNIFGPKFAMKECVSISPENALELEEKWRKLNAELHRLELKKLDRKHRVCLFLTGALEDIWISVL
ncbi:STOREKEEPER protein-like isoform X2 [Salvia miltiorrhiza]|uniref:STOREKEEPER protein-like isoform X2 n=1 Tax=Salvia miltiorrhiza TaxID=226208 RepID=UPI0025ABFE0A|nr:STOREKEEPER protein-like isoform X2 [Salvia miltiorrhiza]